MIKSLLSRFMVPGRFLSPDNCILCGRPATFTHGHAPTVNLDTSQSKGGSFALRSENVTAKDKKICRICGIPKPITEFGRKDSNRDGARHECKQCLSQVERERRLRDGDVIRGKQREKYHANPYPINQQAKKWAKENPERRREIALKYARANLDKIKTWQKNNPEKLREGRRRRQAVRRGKELNNGGEITREEWLSIANATGGLCIYCGRAEKIAIDHFVPLSLGGKTERGNLVPCCVNCNSRKNKHEPNAWIIENFGWQTLRRVRGFLGYV